MLRPSHGISMILICQSLSACGYGVAMKYESKSSVGYDLTIEDFEVNKADIILTQMFAEEGIELIPFADNDIAETFYSDHPSGYLQVKLLKSPQFRTLHIGIIPVRLLSSEKAEQLAGREDAVFRIKKKLIESGQFSDYVRKYE